MYTKLNVFIFTANSFSIPRQRRADVQCNTRQESPFTRAAVNSGELMNGNMFLFYDPVLFKQTAIVVKWCLLLNDMT